MLRSGTPLGYSQAVRGATHRSPGMLLTDHEFAVPLDHDDPSAGETTVFAREVVASRKQGQDLPWVLYLAGGPGARSPRPVSRAGWLGRLLQEYRVVLLDQRGSGRSSPVSARRLRDIGSAPAVAEHLTHFRADSIVRDAELIRRELLGDQKWTVLGQSYGGFVAMTYLSLAPHGLREVMVAGGLPPLDRSAEEVYRATYERVRHRHARFIDRYPGDQARLDAIANAVCKTEVRLPSGARLGVERLQQLGMQLGPGDGFETLHYLLESAWDTDDLSVDFLWALEAATTFAGQPLYALMHESIYCQGNASRWAAQRMRDTLTEFSPEARPLQLTGEMIYPWMFEDDPVLTPYREVADLLAEHEGWPALYDSVRLAANEVPLAATIYHDDMYVEYAYSLETAKRVGAAQYWVTSEFAHDGLRSSDRVLDRLLEMVAGEA